MNPARPQEWTGVPYTKLEHDLLDSDAVRASSPIERDLLVHFVRQWRCLTRKGSVQCGSIPFTWTGYPYPITRTTFRNARRQLQARGCIDCVNIKGGLYALSERWRRYTLTLDEAGRIRKHDEARALRAANTAKIRGHNLPPAVDNGRGHQMPPTVSGETMSRDHQSSPTSGSREGHPMLLSQGSPDDPAGGVTGAPHIKKRQLENDDRVFHMPPGSYTDLVRWANEHQREFDDAQVEFITREVDRRFMLMQNGSAARTNTDVAAAIAKMLGKPREAGAIRELIQGRESKAERLAQWVVRQENIADPVGCFISTFEKRILCADK